METIIITDASVLINLAASQVSNEILSNVGFSFAVCPDVIREVRYLRDSETGKEHSIDLNDHFEAGRLHLIEPESDEEFELLVDYSSMLGRGPGEAMCFALAESRGLCVAIDDRRAIRRALRKYTEFKTIGTLEILQLWQQKRLIGDDQMKAVIDSIERLARFHPSRSHSFFEWWEKCKRV